MHVGKAKQDLCTATDRKEGRVNWWEEISTLIPRTEIKRRIKQEIFKEIK